jgi:hypothetical protein
MSIAYRRAAVLCVVFAAACSSSSHSSSGTGSYFASVPLTAEGQKVATAWCTTIQNCALTDFPAVYGTLDDCIGIGSSQWSQLLALPGVTTTEMDAFVDSLTNGPCLEQPGLYVLPSYGTLAAGAGCVTDFQCASGLCNQSDGVHPLLYSSSFGCGTCEDAVAAGGACSSTTTCMQGYRCTNGTCQTRLVAGAACTTGNDCQSAFCVNNLCVNVTVVAAGGTCGQDYQTCGNGLRCDGTTMKCVAVTITPAGAPCADPGATCVCAAGSYSGGYTDLCTPFLAVGAPCTIDNSYQCYYGCEATVDGGTTGTCAAGNPPLASCP